MRMIQVPKSKPILAWRAWLIKETMVNQFTTKKMLTSTNFQRHRWQKFKKADRAPQLNSDEHGIWAYDTLEKCKNRFGDVTEHAYGQVALWGKVAVHVNGYRAEFAEIRGLVPTHKVITVKYVNAPFDLVTKFGRA